MSPGAPIGLLPAAGRGVRFGASGYAKELFPLLFDGGSERDLEPRPICELALRAIRAAGAERCVVAVSPGKSEVLRVITDGATIGLDLAYLVQPEPRGLPDVVRRAAPWIGERDTVFAMPDTVFMPQHALADVRKAQLETSADLVLGVFPASEPERLGPVEMGEGGAVLAIHDKPGETPHKNTWGVAAWSPRFSRFCADWEEKRRTAHHESEGAIGHVFEAGRRAGLGVRAVFFPDGQFVDVGTPAGLRAALRALATSGVLLPGQASPLPDPSRP